MSSRTTPEGRKIYWRTVFILAVLLIAVSGTGFWALYQMELTDTRENLTELARSQARTLEAVAKFDAYFSGSETSGAARAATLAQFKEGHRAFRGFGKTGEFLLGERVGDELVFLLPAKKLGYRTPAPVSLMASEAGPMEAAINGQSGTMIDIDYGGDRVLAAYEYLPFLDMGLVTKIDMAEFNEPFYRAGLLTVLLALGAILIGAALNARAVSPLINRIVEDAAIIKDREANYRQLVDTIPGIVYQTSAEENVPMIEVSDAISEITGHSAKSFVDPDGVTLMGLVHPDDHDKALVEEEGPFRVDYRIQNADGELRWIGDHGSVNRAADGSLIRKGILLDISERKEAERALKELPRKLSRYISPQVYKSIFHGQQDALVGNTRKKLTVFFSDVVDFTKKSESLDPDDLTHIINSYLNRMAEIAVRHGGTLDKFIGDGVVIFFGDPESRGVREDAKACVHMALDMFHQIEDLNRIALEHGINSPIEIRVGIATGFCTVGNFGSESRMDYTVLGKTVNLAARLESQAPTHGILVASETALLVEDEFVTEASEPIQAKGFEKPVEVFRVLRAKKK